MKEPLRAHFRALRDALPLPRRQRFDARIAAHLESLEQWRDARVVLLYASFGSEVGTANLFEAGERTQKILGLPRVDGKHLTLHRVQPGETLRPNRHGIPEPAAETELLVAEDVRLVVVPGVAFDRRGARLGYGGGYYDRLLRTISHAFRVGIAYEAQVVEHLPTTLLDVPMDALVTENGVRILPRREH